MDTQKANKTKLDPEERAQSQRLKRYIIREIKTIRNNSEIKLQ